MKLPEIVGRQFSSNVNAAASVGPLAAFSRPLPSERTALAHNRARRVRCTCRWLDVGQLRALGSSALLPASARERLPSIPARPRMGRVSCKLAGKNQRPTQLTSSASSHDFMQFPQQLSQLAPLPSGQQTKQSN